MSAIADKMNKTPWLYITTCLLALAFIAIKFTGLEIPQAGAVVILEVILLGFAVFGSVHHAEILAAKTGEPLGSIILALAVTIIEVALIVSQMSAGAPGAQEIGRDTVFATIMIVLNGVVGLALLIGAARHYEQKFNLDGATSALSVLGTLAASALILPNFTVAAAGPFYSNSQLAFVAVVSITLYAIFVFVQTVRHNEDFSSENEVTAPTVKPTFRTVFISGVFLPLTLLAVVMMAKLLSPSVAASIQAAGLPASFLGV
ncbi:MAG: ionic transporter y4hA, partial [Aestuariivirga sp.]